MAAPESRPDDALLSRLREDLSMRWQQGERVGVESYLAQYPHLANDSDAVAELVCAEMLLRYDHKEAPTVEEYVGRFEKHADAIRRHWSIHRKLHDPTVDPRETGVTAAAAARLHPEIPGFAILEELDRGGMGLVYKAWQAGFNRFVALKTISESGRRSPVEMQRFANEIQAVGRLRHPHVVGVYACGEHQGLCYFAMEFFAKGSLQKLLAGGPLSHERTARLVRQIALGIQAAHEHGIIHRDLKPGNVLIDDEGNAKVGDFGLARLQNQFDDLTRPDDIMGTPLYMSPEQAAGRALEVSASADVWAMGVILYECLTGQLPFRGRSARETIDLVEKARLTPPRRVDAAVPVGLDRICRKCLQKNPKHRYPSAAALAADLERYLAGEQVEAPKRTWPNWCRPWQAALVGLVVVLGGAAVAMGPEGKPTPSLEPELRDGKGTLLAGKGPIPGKPVYGRKTALLTTDEQGYFAISTQDLYLHELAGDPKLERYRLTAEIRHLRQTFIGARVGLYLSRQQSVTSGGIAHQYLAVAFNDLEDEPKLHRSVAKVSPFPLGVVPKGNAVELDGFALVGKDWTGRSDGESRGRFPCFEAHGSENGPWRTLIVEVSPDRVKVFWSTGADRIVVGSVEARDYVKGLSESLATSKIDALREVQASFSPRGGLGVLVFRGTAAFRNVAIVPLPPAPANGGNR